MRKPPRLPLGMVGLRRFLRTLTKFHVGVRRECPKNDFHRKLVAIIFIEGSPRCQRTCNGGDAQPSSRRRALCAHRTRKSCHSLADEASSAADDVLFKIAPSFPQALIWAETDDPFWYGVKSGERIPVRDIDFLRDWLKLPERPDRPWPQDICRFPLIPLRAFAERAREIVRAKDEFEASWRAAEEHPNVLDANARSEALSERWSELAMRVATTPAKTMEGLIDKIAFDRVRIRRRRP